MSSFNSLYKTHTYVESVLGDVRMLHMYCSSMLCATQRHLKCTQADIQLYAKTLASFGVCTVGCLDQYTDFQYTPEVLESLCPTTPATCPVVCCHPFGTARDKHHSYQQTGDTQGSSMQQVTCLPNADLAD